MLPDTPVGRQVAWMVERLAQGGEVPPDEVEERMVLTGVSTDDIRAAFARLAAQGPMTIDVVDDTSPYACRASAWLGGARLSVGAQVERHAPHRLTYLRFRRIERFRDIYARVEPAAGSVRDLVRDVVEPVAGRLAAGGISVGVIADGGVHTTCFGDLTADAVLEIGSLTKPFTATLLADMVQREEVRFEDVLSTFVPAASAPRDPDGAEITIESLATHTSGLPRQPAGWTPADRDDPYADFTVDELYRSLALTELDTTVGSAVAYSNLGYALLGHVLSVAAGRPYGALLAERVCRPLGLLATTTDPDDRLRARRATGHRYSGAPTRPWSRPVQDAAGGLESTIDDMVAWMQAQLEARTPAVALTQQPRAKTGLGAWIALGWYILGCPVGGRVIVHSGRTGGSTSSMAFHPSSRIGVVLLANSTSERLDQPTREVLAALIKASG